MLTIRIIENFQIAYKADSTQISVLQMLSTGGQQNITFHCKNTAAYFDSDNSTYQNGLKLLTWNEAELAPDGKKRFRYEVIKDDCQVIIFYFISYNNLLFVASIANSD